MELELLHQASKHTINVSDDIDLFRLQITSLTGINPENQTIVFCHTHTTTTTIGDGTTTTNTTTRTVTLPSSSTAVTPPAPYTASFADVLQLLQSQSSSSSGTAVVVACLLHPYVNASDGNVMNPDDDVDESNEQACAVAAFIGPLKMQELAQGVAGFMSRQKESQFYRRLENASKHVQMYEDADLQRYALSKIPLADLFIKAVNDTSNSKLSFGDHLIRHFGHWFRHTFFTWMNGIKCEA